MRRLTVIIIAFAAVATAIAQVSYDNTKAKANRFFDNQEWASAAALYGLMINERPDVPDTYGRAIVSNEMLDNNPRCMQLLTQAMNYGVPLDSVLSNVKQYSFEVGQGNLYERFMLNAAAEHYWLERPLDAYLLRYYAFRRNGSKMIEYSTKMLAGTPDNVEFLAIKAEGEMLEGNPQGAVDAWTKIVELDHRNLPSILSLANYYDETDNPTSAMFYFQKAYNIHPTPFVAEAIKRLQGK